MHKTLAAAGLVALLGAAGAANAADFYAPGYKDGPVAPVPTWTGWYLGGHVGGAWSANDYRDVTSFPTVAFNNDASGFFGGAQAGFLYQLGNIVIGPEVDFGGVDLAHSTAEVGGLGAVGSVNSGFYFDITGRLGYSWGPTLLYIKGGYANYSGSLKVSDATGSVSHSSLSGWTGGGGIEYQINPAWSLKAEYQFFEFNTFQLIIPVSGDTFDDRFTANTFKVGFNYHFCTLYQPLK